MSPVDEDKPSKQEIEGYSIHFGPIAGTEATAMVTATTTFGAMKNVQSPNLNNIIRPIPVVPAALVLPPSSKMADLNLNKTIGTDPLLPALSLKIPTPSQPPPSLSTEQKSPTAARHASASTFQAMTSSGDSIISVA